MKKMVLIAVFFAFAVFSLSGLPALADWEDYEDGDGHWAEETLKRAVEDGFLEGYYGLLDPDGDVTLAQAVAIINRALETDVAERFSGITSSKWYYEDALKGNALGLYDSPSAADFESAMTRSEVFILLGTAFGISSALPDYSVLDVFSDCSGLAGDALNAAASLAECGFITGSYGKLMPESTITRAEFVTILYRILDSVLVYDCTEDTVSIPAGSDTVLVRSSSLERLSLKGSTDTLILASLSGDVSLRSSYSVNTLRVGSGGGDVTVSGNVSSIEITGNGRTVYISSDDVESVIISGSGCSVYINNGALPEKISITETGSGNTVIVNSSAGDIQVSGDDNDIFIYGTVQSLALAGEDNSAEIQGTAENLSVSGEGSVVGGTGFVSSGSVEAVCASVRVGSSEIPDTELELSAPPVVEAGGSLTVTAAFNFAGSEITAMARWFENGSAVAGYENSVFRLSSAASSSYSPVIAFSEEMADKITIGFSLFYSGGGEILYLYEEISVPIENYSDEYYYNIKMSAEYERVLELVSTYEYPAEITAGCSLYESENLKGWIRSLTAGTEATVIYRSSDYSSYKIKLSDGTEGWIKSSCAELGTGNYTLPEDYSNEDKELWVDAMGYSSSTDYLVWVSLACQKVNIFEGCEGSWELIASYTCASGKASTPTPMGVYEITYKKYYWEFDYYYCGPVTGFNGAYAFHSVLHTYDGGEYDYTLGEPVSHGCIRLSDEAAEYIFSLPFGTTVVIY